MRTLGGTDIKCVVGGHSQRYARMYDLRVHLGSRSIAGKIVGREMEILYTKKRNGVALARSLKEFDSIAAVAALLVSQFGNRNPSVAVARVIHHAQLPLVSYQYIT